jgi:DNA-binding transcriptional MerR regulator
MKPTYASARATPSARAVRFYVANGLLDRPEGAGTAATYGYRHLLQLLAIKIRQREGQTLDAIKQEMREVTGDALERRVAASLAPALTLQLDTAAPKQHGVASWRHVPIADGVELLVRDDSPAARDDLLVSLRDMLRHTLGRNDFSL